MTRPNQSGKLPPEPATRRARPAAPATPGRNRVLVALGVWLLACLHGCPRRKTDDSSSKRTSAADKALPEAVRAEKALEPRLLRDTDELDRYIEAFPRQLYRVVEVKMVGSFYLDDNPALVKRHLALGLPWEPHVLVLFARHARPGSTAIDVGAHIGSLTVPLGRAVGPEGKVFAFEPVKKVYRELVHNLRLNGAKNVKPLRFAVGARNQVIEMEPMASLDGRTGVGEGGDKVELRTLDSFEFKDVSLIKIDVEGFETEVLKGAERTIRTWHPAIILEIMHAHLYNELAPAERARVDETRKLLELYGYVISQIQRDMHDYLALYAGKQAQAEKKKGGKDE